MATEIGVFLATKVSGDYSRQGITTAIENSLKMLGVDCVDLYQIHGWNSEYPIEESMEAMRLLQKQGKPGLLRSLILTQIK